MLKLLFPLIQVVISLNTYSQDSYLRVVSIKDMSDNLIIRAIDDAGNRKDTITLISLKDTMYFLGKPLNKYWSNYGNFTTIEVGKSYPFYTFEIVYSYRVGSGLYLRDQENNLIYNNTITSNNLPRGIANSFGWTLQWWNPILPHSNTKTHK